MKVEKSIILFFILFSFCLVAFAPLPNNNSNYNAAIVLKVIQDVKHKKPQTSWLTTKPSTQLETNDQLRTGEKSVAVVRFVDGSSLRVREKTIITIFADKRERGLIKNTKIDVGKMRFDVEKQQDDDEFIITTPTAVATIRGTSGLVNVLEDGQTILTVETGIVDVKALFGTQQSTSVEAGRTSIINRDGNISVNQANEQQLNEVRNSLKSNEKFIRVITPQGTFRVYYLDFE
ncbi:MAG: FecR family protein [Ignavibacteria bacterium]|nr:FecR family protein [Ignavibacteria bacterium]